uniref:Uncharacterized protein n=1 Tax=Rhizophora mucronata TaxID=61149 RepID=A0A2P2PC11_RHIMU
MSPMHFQIQGLSSKSPSPPHTSMLHWWACLHSFQPTLNFPPM